MCRRDTAASGEAQRSEGRPRDRFRKQSVALHDAREFLAFLGEAVVVAGT